MKFYLFLTFLFYGVINSQAQNLFLEECFVGGITVAGRTAYSIIDGPFKIKWESDYNLKSAYVLTYRYGRPVAKPFTVNNAQFMWDNSSQIGEEQVENENIEFFTVHGQEITDKVNIVGDSVHVYMDAHDHIDFHPNQGWWSLDFVFLYTSPSIVDTACVRIYTASQPQIAKQSYKFLKPIYKPETDVAFSIYSDRITAERHDESRIVINDEWLGDIWGNDAANPLHGADRKSVV